MKIVIKSGTIEVNAKFKLKALANGLLHIANAIGAMAEKDGEWLFCIEPGESICSNASYKFTMYVAGKIDEEGSIPVTGQKILIDGEEITSTLDNYFEVKNAALPTTPAPDGYQWTQASTFVNKTDKDFIVEILAEPANQNQMKIVYADNDSVRLDSPNKWSLCVIKKAVSDYDVMQIVGKPNLGGAVPLSDIIVKFKGDPKEYSFIGNGGNLLPYDIKLTVDQSETAVAITLQHTRDQALLAGIKILPENQDMFLDFKANADANPTTAFDPVDKTWKSFIDPIKDTESNKWEYSHFKTYGTVVGDIIDMFEFKGNLVAFDDKIVITSPNGKEWTTRTTNLNNITSVVTDGNSIVIVGGTTEPLAYSSTDPINGGWGTIGFAERPNNTGFLDIVYNGSIFFGMTHRYFYKASDLSNWSDFPLTDIDPELVTTKLPIVKQILSLTDGKLLVLIQPDGTGNDDTQVLYASSDNALTWSKVTNFSEVAYAPGFKLHVANDVLALSQTNMSNAWVSKDSGVTWTMTTGSQNTSPIKEFKYYDGTYIFLLIGNQQSSMLISTNALNWNSADQMLPNVNDVIMYDNQTFVCMSSQSNGTPIAISRDGTFTYIKPKNAVPVTNDLIYYKKIVKFKGNLVCVGNGTQQDFNRIIVGGPY